MSWSYIVKQCNEQSKTASKKGENEPKKEQEKESLTKANQILVKLIPKINNKQQGEKYEFFKCCKFYEKYGYR